MIRLAQYLIFQVRVRIGMWRFERALRGYQKDLARQAERQRWS